MRKYQPRNSGILPVENFKHRIKVWPCSGGWGGVTAALFNFIPHFYPSTVWVCPTLFRSPNPLPKIPHFSFCSPDKILLPGSPQRSPPSQTPPHLPSRMSASPLPSLSFMILWRAFHFPQVWQLVASVSWRLWAYRTQGPSSIITEFPDGHVLDGICSRKI